MNVTARRSRVDSPKPYRPSHRAAKPCQGCGLVLTNSARPGYHVCPACAAGAAEVAGADDAAWHRRFWNALQHVAA